MSYSEEFKLKVVAEYESGGVSLEALKRKYNVGGNTTIGKWVKKYGTSLNPAQSIEPGEEYRNDRDNAREELEKELKEARLKIASLEALIEASKNYTGIDIKKKFGGKP